MPQHNPDFEGNPKGTGKRGSPARTRGRKAPSVDALASAAYEAAARVVRHVDTCNMCTWDGTCDKASRLIDLYKEKKSKALKAIRKAPKTRGKK